MFQLKTLAAVTLALLGTTAPGLAQDAGAPPAAATPPVPEKSWNLDLGADYASRYLFRGVSLLADQRVIVPHARFGTGNLALYYYGYFGAIPATKDKYQEADFGADYTFTFGENVSLTLGAVTYQYNQAAENDIAFLDTYEVYGVLAFDTLLSPTITYYRDVDKVKGGYLSLGISHRFGLSEKISLDLSSSVGFDFHYNNKDVRSGSFNDVLIGADLPVQITEAFSVHAMVQRTISQKSLDDIVRKDSSLKPLYGDQTVVSAGISYSF